MEVQEIERQIARRIIDDALAAGFAIDVYDGGDFAIEKSTDADAIFSAMFSTDDDRLYMHKDGKQVGSVWLIYGESGWDVITDYSMSIDDLLQGALKLSEELEGKLNG
ncbi:hypothetical protein V1279_002959 [Bradyrhizobium sp. AZCC 1610]|uniref:hypothetical protein n=1 Tax=Bradyrhizobium sp. AZCC 1610 TaxID=3117020 RepID=UPI002FF12E9D